MFLYILTGGIVIKRYVYVNGNERYLIENLEQFGALAGSGKITKDTFLLDEETQAWVGVLQIPEFSQFFMSNAGSPYPPNQQFQQQAYQQNYQNPGFNTNQGFNPNQNYNQGQGFNYNVNYPKPPKRKGKVAAIVLAFVFIIAGLGAGAYFLFLKDSGKTVTHDQEIQAKQKLASLVSSFNSGKSILGDSNDGDNSGSLSPKLASDKLEDQFGGLYPIVEATEKYYMEIQKGKDEAETAIQDLTSESIFTEEILSDPNKLSEAKSKISKFITVIKNFENLIISSTDKFQKTVQDSDMPNNFKSSFMNGFEQGNNKMMDLLKKVFNTYETALTKLSDLFTFLQGKQGDYEVSSDATISFYTDEDTDAYNKIFTEMQDALSKGEDLQKELEDKSTQGFDGLEDFAD